MLVAMRFTTSAAPGDLDLTFGVNGRVTTDVVASGIEGAYAIAIEPNGKLVVVGTSQANGGIPSDFSAVRYNANGGVDTSFNGTGRITTSFNVLDYAHGVAVQPDGKIVVVGAAGNTGGVPFLFALARYTANGALDTTFNSTGKVTTAIGGAYDEASCVAVQNDGKIVVAGSAANPLKSDFAVVRYNTNGTLDTTFNGIGKVTTDVGGLGESDSAVCMVVQPDGKIVVAGNATINGLSRFALVRYNVGGTLDDAFGNEGIEITDSTSLGDTLIGMALQADGKIVLGGNSNTGDPEGTYITFARYNPNGVLDTTFAGSGRVSTLLTPTNTAISSLALQADGKIVVAGPSPQPVGGIAVLLARYNNDGGLDNGFGNNGRVIATGGGEIRAIAIQPDGKIVGVGTIGSPGANFFAIRFEGQPFVPEIVVEQPAGTALVDGIAGVAFGNVLVGGNASRSFTIKNSGGAPLTGLSVTFDGIDAASFAATINPAVSVPAGGITTFTIRFDPTGAGSKTAALHLANNDSDESPFDVALTARALAPNADDDGDGVTNEAELNLAAQGFDPLVVSTSLRTLIHANALGLGLYRASDVQTLALGIALLDKDPASGHFRLALTVEKSANLATWAPLLNFTPTYDAGTGKITLDIAPDAAAAQFYRVLGQKP